MLPSLGGDPRVPPSGSAGPEQGKQHRLPGQRGAPPHPGTVAPEPSGRSRPPLPPLSKAGAGRAAGSRGRPTAWGGFSLPWAGACASGPRLSRQMALGFGVRPSARRCFSARPGSPRGPPSRAARRPHQGRREAAAGQLLCPGFKEEKRPSGSDPEPQPRAFPGGTSPAGRARAARERPRGRGPSAPAGRLGPLRLRSGRSRAAGPRAPGASARLRRPLGNVPAALRPRPCGRRRPGRAHPAWRPRSALRSFPVFVSFTPSLGLRLPAGAEGPFPSGQEPAVRAQGTRDRARRRPLAGRQENTRGEAPEAQGRGPGGATLLHGQL